MPTAYGQEFSFPATTSMMLGPQVGTCVNFILLTVKFLETSLVPNKPKQSSEQILLNHRHEQRTDAYLLFETWADLFPVNLPKIKYLFYFRNSFFKCGDWKGSGEDSDLHGKGGINNF